jgi:error-prone DNA polymerase
MNEEYAERIFKQLEGFGSYGFPESHAYQLCAFGLYFIVAKMPLPGCFCGCSLLTASQWVFTSLRK